MRPGAWRDVQLDITSPTALRALLERERPGIVFFCAYDRENRIATVDAPVRAAALAARLGARFIFFSTDLVFDGRTGGYKETDTPSPIMAYGAMKAEAEVEVHVENPGAAVIRASLFVGESGVMLRPAYECENLLRGQPATLYRDEYRSPTHVDDVARAAWDLARHDYAGVFHVAGPDRLSRVELGKLLCKIFRLDASLLREGASPPDRPKDTSLDGRRTNELLGWAPRSLVQIAQRSSSSALPAYA